MCRRCRSSTWRDVLVFARVGPIERRRRVRHLPLPQSSGERAGLLLLARSHDAAASRAARNGSSPSRRSSRSARADVKYMISFALPRFCDQSLDRSRKERFYPGAEPWIAKLDTVVHELYHIDPELTGIRRIETRRRHLLGATATASSSSSRSPTWSTTYLDSGPSPDVYDFLRDDFDDARGAARRRRRHELPHVPVVPAALHRAAGGAAAVRRRQRRRDDRTAARAQQPTRVHRGRPAHPAVHEGHARGGSFARVSSGLRNPQLATLTFKFIS